MHKTVLGRAAGDKSASKHTPCACAVPVACYVVYMYTAASISAL